MAKEAQEAQWLLPRVKFFFRLCEKFQSVIHEDYLNVMSTFFSFKFATA